MTRRLDRLAAALGLGEAAAPVLERLKSFYQQVDRELSDGAAGLELPCRMGCDACCHESVFVSAPEVLLVAEELLATRTRPELEVLVEQMRELARQFEDELELLETIPPGSERDEVAARVRFRCPLLSGEGTCSVYGSRELNARTFGQSWDTARDEPYGCTLTVGRLQVVGAPRARRLSSARALRAELSRHVPGTERVHVYPWWFARFGDVLLEREEGEPAGA